MMDRTTSEAIDTTRRSARPLLSGNETAWTEEADVVVIGCGVAGVCAAIEAARNGARVLVIERTGGWGGAAALAGGFIYLGGGTALQRACGFEDTPEDMFAFLSAAVGSTFSQAKLSVYVERSVDHFNWLVSCGVPFRAKFFEAPAWEPFGDEGLMYSGGENAYPFADIARPAPRGHIPRMKDKRTGERGGGYMLMKPLMQTAEALGVRIRYNTRFERLVIDPNSRHTVGVALTSFGERVNVKARRGVVLAAGGFAFNPEMIEQHVPVLAGRPGSATEQHDGQAIRAAQWVGADVAHMEACEAAVHTDPGLMIRSIVVNQNGHRFINEDTYAGRIGHELLRRHGSQGFVVTDEQALEEAVASNPSSQRSLRPSWVSDDVAEIEAAAGMPEGSLANTLDQYNRHARAGTDPAHHKSSHWLRPLEPPYGVIDLRGATSGFPLGGLRTDENGAVLDMDGIALDGLWAAGRTTQGIASAGYASGCSLGDGSFFGRRAGGAAARSAD